MNRRNYIQMLLAGLAGIFGTRLGVEISSKKNRRSIGLEDRNGRTIREGDRFRCKVTRFWSDYDRPRELEGTIKWAKYSAGYTLQVGDRTIAFFRSGGILPEIKELPDGRIDGEVLA